MTRSHVTSKAKNIALMLQHGFRVPMSFYLENRTKLESEIPNLLGQHPQKTWIVRSSFGVEDGFESTFAGCFSSEVVEAPTVASLLHAIERVAASILTEQAREQILASGQNPDRCRVGVIVQEFIVGQVSGVAFSKDPSTSAEGFTEWVIGGCSHVTDGEVQVQRANLNDHPPAMLKPFWRELRRGMQRLEKLLVSPVDVEWTFDGRYLWWLQVRPMTGESIVRLKKSQGGAKWTRDKIAERFPDLMTPMGWSMIEETLEHSMASFVEFTGVKCRNIERASLFERGYAYANERYFRFANASLTPKAFFGLLARSLLALVRIGLPFRKRSLWLSRFAHKVFLKSASRSVLHKWYQELDGHIVAIRNFDPNVSDLKFATAKIHELRALSFGFFKTDLAIHCLKEANVHLLTGALGMKSDRITRFGKNETLLMHASLQALCDALKSDLGSATFIAALKRDDQQAQRFLTKTSYDLFRAFLDHCGHMSEGWDVTSRALRENSGAIAVLIEMAMRQEKKPREKRQESQDDLPEELEHMFAQAQALCAADEQQHFYAGLYLEKSRKVLDSIARLMIERNLIESRDDLHYLTATELEKFLHNPDFPLIHFVRRKRKIWSRYKNVTKISESAATQQLNGLAVSHGVAQGKCYFADSFGDLEQMPENAVLCLKTPNPSFVPWFNLCSAIVTENGGALSHGFIAARELQIPAVCGIRLDDLRLLDHVIVDGSKGHVSPSVNLLQI